MDTQFYLVKNVLRALIVILLALGVVGFVYAQSQSNVTVTDCSTQTDIPQAECEALVALYNSTDGPNWIDNTGWNTSQSPCDWNGIICAQNHVFWLQLPSNSLSGNIPAELGNLSELETLDLPGNNLTGNIPAELGNLTKLKLLSLGGNTLNGAIPSELGALTSLDDLYLEDNALSGSIPTELGKLTNARYFNVSKNTLSGSIPPQLGNLTNLIELNLSTNDLSGSIPPELGNLTNLDRMYMKENSLSGSIPPELGSLSNLRLLDLHSNELQGEIPGELGGLTNLTSLTLSTNRLGGSIPAELGQMTNLNGLDLQENLLSGTIPATFGNLSNLHTLKLTENELGGSIPAELGNLSVLTLLDLSSNKLSGAIPAELGNLTRLQTLFLNNNRLSGEIPSELSNLSQMKYLYLSFNQLEGSVPPELGNLNTLVRLWLHGNQLEGDIPIWLMDLSRLEYFSVMDNKFNIDIDDTEFLAFLDENDPNWFITQTRPPVGVKGSAPTPTTIYAYWQWTDTALDGYFELGYRTIPDGDFTPLDRTDKKTVTSMTVYVPNLTEMYSFAVRVVTPSHDRNENTLISDWSEEVLLSTYEGPADPEPTLDPPAVVQNLTIDLRQGRPLINWPDDPNSEWYHIYVGSSDYSVHLLDTWIEGVEYCSDGLCSVILPIDPVAGIYHVWMQSWGNGQYSIGGDSGYDGWTHVTFELPNTPPQAITGTTVTQVNGQINLSWHAPTGATWYNVWLGTGSPDWTPIAFVWLDADTLGCGDGGTCSIPAFALPAWNYVWYIRSWGPGGFSTGGLVDAPGWVQGVDISMP